MYDAVLFVDVKYFLATNFMHLNIYTSAKMYMNIGEDKDLLI